MNLTDLISVIVPVNWAEVDFLAPSNWLARKLLEFQDGDVVLPAEEIEDRSLQATGPVMIDGEMDGELEGQHFGMVWRGKHKGNFNNLGGRSDIWGVGGGMDMYGGDSMGYGNGYGGGIGGYPSNMGIGGGRGVGALYNGPHAMGRGHGELHEFASGNDRYDNFNNRNRSYDRGTASSNRDTWGSSESNHNSWDTGHDFGTSRGRGASNNLMRSNGVNSNYWAA